MANPSGEVTHTLVSISLTGGLDAETQALGVEPQGEDWG